jgi:hypothetical protein
MMRRYSNLVLADILKGASYHRLLGMNRILND